jgi:ankyrin repeat protein
MDIFAEFSPQNVPVCAETGMELFEAASRSDLTGVRLLLAQGADATSIINGFNSLHISVKKGHIAVVEEILKHNSISGILDTRTDNGRSPLMIAAFEGSLDCIKLLHAHGASSSEASDEVGNNALHFASWGGNLNVYRYLVEEMNYYQVSTNAEGMYPIHFAAAGNHVDILEYLILLSEENTKSAVACTSSGYNSLHRAAMYGSVEAVKLLLEKNIVNVNECSTNGCTALAIACQNGKVG